MKRFVGIALFALVLTLSGCASATIGGGDEGVSYLMADSGSGTTTGEVTTSDTTTDDDVVTTTTQTVTVAAGQLTAAEWIDVEHYDFYLSLFAPDQDQSDGVFQSYQALGYFDTLNMVHVQVTNGDAYVSGALVELVNELGNTIVSTITNVFGQSYLFPGTDVVGEVTQIVVTKGEATITVDYVYDSENRDVQVDLVADTTASEMLDIMFVIDTTGSMGDEISYLKAEIANVIAQVQEMLPNVTIRLALLFYRDDSDAYVTRYYDFSTNISAQQLTLSLQNASGGGDYPEAVDTALNVAMQQAWSDASSTKLLFHVLDAPPHDDQESMTTFTNAIQTAAQQGIRIIPVASSGVDKWTEYLLRCEAMMTGGTYVFLTNDSGIGGDHIEATVGEYTVEYLNSLLIRLIVKYQSGTELDIVPWRDDFQQ
ncbi:MAG: VWA domain-containing protein [Candidatus Izemoplasmatales bacterium]|nr:VWA domain-containing protein [Candidatus Izemoplasmatales bacterium]